ncbi:MAG: acylphosphatase [Chloroflexota bacterium]
MTEPLRMQRLEATVRGYVQGVGYRWFVVKRATQLGLTGWTANESDGTVRVVAEGSPPVLDELLQLLHEGPAGANVERVDADRLPPVGGLRGFSIRSGGHSGD